MEIYLRAANGKYLAVGEGAGQVPVIAATEQPGLRSLLQIDNYDPVTHGVPNDPSFLSHNLISLSSRDRVLLTSRDAMGQFRLVADTALRTPQDAPRIGFDAYRIILIPGNSKGEPLQFGHRVAFQLAPPEGERRWLSVLPGTEDVVGFLPESAISSLDTAAFEILPPVDLADFAIDYMGFSNEVVVGIWLTGSALPGGSLVTLESMDGADVLELGQAIVDEPSASFGVPTKHGFSQISPCNKREITVRAIFNATGSTMEQTLALEGERADFLRMKLVGVRPARKMPTWLRRFWPGGKRLAVHAQLILDPYEQRIDPSELPLKVQIVCDNPIVQNITQSSNELTAEQPIKFRFEIERPKEDAPKVCMLFEARFQLGGQARRPKFPYTLGPKGMSLDPQKEAKED